MASKMKKSWLPNGNKGGWALKRDSSDGKFTTAHESAKAARFSTKSVSGRIALPNGDMIKTVRKDVMDKALGRDGSKKR